MSDIKYSPGDEYFQNLKDGPQRFPAVYYFPGSGPVGETCGSCDNFIVGGNTKRGRCKKWILHRGHADRLEMRDQGDTQLWWRGLPAIKSITVACKYWLKKKEETTIGDIQP